MTPAQSFKLRSLIANLINATVSGEPNSRQLAHEDHLRNYVTNLTEEKDAEIERLKAQLESIRAAHDEAQAVLSVLNADSTVAMFQIATHFQTMGNKVGRILQDGQS